MKRMEKKRTDQVQVGEESEPLEFSVTPEFNECYLDAEEDHNPIYMEQTDFGPPVVLPALLHNMSNSTRSPSFFLPDGMAGVMTKDEIEFMNPARVGKKFHVTWKVVDRYEKGGRTCIVREGLMRDEDGLEILRRRTEARYFTLKKE